LKNLGIEGLKKQLNREGAKGFFVGFVLILKERLRMKTHQALTGGNRIDDCRLKTPQSVTRNM
jgi:hypothetical protein